MTVATSTRGDLTARIYALWLLAVLVIFAPRFLLHFDIFRLVGARYANWLAAALAAGLVAGCCYHFLRQRGLWRIEPSVWSAAIVFFCAFYAPIAVCVALAMLAASYVVGSRVMAAMRLPSEPALAALFGFGVYSCAFFLLGLARGYYTPVFALLIGAPLIVFWKDLRDLSSRGRALCAAWAGDSALRSPLVSAAVFSAVLLAIFAALELLTPAWNGDTIRFHLPLAMHYLQAHSLDAPRTITYGYFPQSFEVLMTAALALGGQTAAQAVNPLLFCITLSLLFAIARWCGATRASAVAGVVLGACVPFLHWSGSVAKNDMPLAGFLLGALLCFLRWRDDGLFRWIPLGAFLLAMSFGMKHVAIFGALPLLIFFAYAAWQQQRRWSALAAVLLIVVVFGAFWNLRGYLAVGLAPLLAAKGLAEATVKPSMGLLDRLWRDVTFPFRVHWDAKRRFESGSPTPLGIVLPLLAPLWLMRAANPTGKRREAVLWVFVLLYSVTWITSFGILRYGIAVVLILAVLGAARFAKLPVWVGTAVLCLAMLYSLPVIIVAEMAPAQVDLFLRHSDAPAFLRATLPPYAAVEFLNSRAGAGLGIASVGDWAVAYAPEPGAFDHVYNNTRVYEAKEVTELLRRGPFRFLILPNSKNRTQLEEAAAATYVLRGIYSDENFNVYELTPRAGAAPLL